MPAKFYFENRATPKLHSELGMPNIVTDESLQAMMPDSAQWPIGRMWGIHDFCQYGAQGAATYLDMFAKNFGPVDNVQDWVTFAQFINYSGYYRAMFEAQGRNRMGLTI